MQGEKPTKNRREWETLRGQIIGSLAEAQAHLLGRQTGETSSVAQTEALHSVTGRGRAGRGQSQQIAHFQET